MRATRPNFLTTRSKTPVYFVRKIKLQGSVPFLGQNLISNSLELLKNSIIQINKTALIDRFHETATDGKLIFQQL
ncbi:hypothetical protein LBK6_13305 [Leptospira borgpetersenii serovar Hardjo]|nr:hypothetical protein LBK6_13305 [Leptospira borgpetersenii serovar Hardjo]AMX62496.1 hypothetical protein LBK9_13210 [Leptospira borgpetersenii serovar Hardjo]AMX65738.1 hypothetical protein LBK30_13225 [Leptospira borgpetersenii serovar Hardjo]AMX68971.1 hypothetical protein LBHA_13180 [Leptospira borgpetersenii serovar Hardjo]